MANSKNKTPARLVQNSNNIVHILKQIWMSPGISRIEISKRLKLDKSTVTIIVNRLHHIGLVEETEARPTVRQGGRRPIGLRMKRRTGIIIGLEMQTDYYRAVFTDLSGQEIFRQKQKNPEGGSLAQIFLTIYKELYRRAEEQGLPLLAIGVGLPGAVNPYKGILCQSRPLGTEEDYPFFQEIKPFVSVPLFLDNDANCGCWAEMARSREARLSDFLMVLGEFRQHSIAARDIRILAVGLGMVIDEKVHFGRDFSAGEYISPTCFPGNIGQFPMTEETLHTLKSDGQIMEYVKKDLTRDIAFLANIMGFNKIVFGGDVIQFLSDLIPVLKDQLSISTTHSRAEEMEILPSAQGEFAVAYGAASMVMEKIFLTYDTPAENPWEQRVGNDLITLFEMKQKQFRQEREMTGGTE